MVYIHKKNSGNYMKKFLYFTVFVSGMTTLAVEISASRLIGSVFGTSNLVWASIIGLILIYLTFGYYLGGKVADKSPNFKTLYKILAWGSFFIGVVPYIAKPLLRFAADAFDGLQIGILAGSFITVLVLFSIPVTLLGMISPFAIRMSIDDPKNAGNVSGKIYAVSTLGSFLGSSSIKNSSGQIFEKESAYNYIQVLEKDGYYLLRLNEGQGVHSIYKAGEYDF